MKHPLYNLAAAAGVALTLVLGAVAPAAAQQGGDCLSPREIQEAVASGAIVTIDEAMSADGIDQRPLGQTRVCRNNGELEYHVNIMGKSGETDTRVLNAQDG